MKQPRIYRAVPVVICEDAPLHTDERPFCSDPTCPCNALENVQRLFYIHSGLLTAEEAGRLADGTQLVPSDQEEAPECPSGYYWNGRQCLRENGWPTLSLAEREGW